MDGITLPPFPVVGARFFCSNNIWWRVVGANGNYRLIMAEGAYSSGNWANRQTNLTTWAANNLAPELRAAIRTPINAGLDLNVMSRPGSAPDPNTAANQNAAVFILSEAEVDNLIRPIRALEAAVIARERVGRMSNLRAGRHVRTYFNSLQPMSSGTAQAWWLRSHTVGRYIHASGIAVTTTSSRLMRPALWVSAEEVTLGTETFVADAETFHTGNDLGAMWRNAVENPAVDGGVWGQFWTEASNTITSGGGAYVLRNDGNGRSSRLSNAHLVRDGGGYVTHHPIDGIVLPPYPYVGSRFFCSFGIWWRVINADATGNYRLVVMEAVVGDVTCSNQMGTSMRDWAASNLAPELRMAIRTPVNAASNANTVSNPGDAPAPNNQNSAVFTLSEAEVTAARVIPSLQPAMIGRARPGVIRNFDPEDHFFMHFNPGQLISSGFAQRWWVRGTTGRNVGESGTVNT